MRIIYIYIIFWQELGQIYCFILINMYNSAKTTTVHFEYRNDEKLFECTKL